MNNKTRLKWIRIIAIISILISSYLVYEHYRTTPSKFCTFGTSFDCDLVNKSPYSNIDGIFYFMNFDLGLSTPSFGIPFPVAMMSILMFLLIIKMSYSIEKKKSFLAITPQKQITFLKTLMVISILFAFYLVYIETYVLLSYCIYCLTLDLLIITEAIFIKGLNSG